MGLASSPGSLTHNWVEPHSQHTLFFFIIIAWGVDVRSTSLVAMQLCKSNGTWSLKIIHQAVTACNKCHKIRMGAALGFSFYFIVFSWCVRFVVQKRFGHDHPKCEISLLFIPLVNCVCWIKRQSFLVSFIVWCRMIKQLGPYLYFRTCEGASKVHISKSTSRCAVCINNLLLQGFLLVWGSCVSPKPLRSLRLLTISSSHVPAARRWTSFNT